MSQHYGTGLSKAERIARRDRTRRGRPMTYAPIPSDAQRAVLARMKDQGDELRYWTGSPSVSAWIGQDRISIRTFDAMRRAGWIEKDTEPGAASTCGNGDRWILTPSGRGA